MEQIYLKARAKINLNLEILNKREDGYHNLESVFQKINLYDEIIIKKTETNKCIIHTNFKELENEENIIYKAYLKLKERYTYITGIEVNLHKNIPMQAGLAGGSTDCASFLKGMNKLFDLKLSNDQIEEIGSSLGADVVPCLYDGAVFAEGIGNIITPIHTNFKYYVVLVKAQIIGNTKQMYEKIDNGKVKSVSRNSNNIIKALENNDIKLLANNLYNVFEEVIEPKEIVQEIKKEFINEGAIGSGMTGSGSCVYGIFNKKSQAKLAYKNLKEKYETYITVTCKEKKNV